MNKKHFITNSAITVKMKNKLLYGLLILGSVLTSCSSDNEFEYVPFKSSENGGWGLINAKGKVKFDGEFKREITAAGHDVFFAKNSKGEWDLYSLKDKTPKAISTGYAEAGAFIADVAPVVKEGERITLINNKGEVVVTLDTAGGQPIEVCSNFYEGLARVYTSDGWGVINTAGEEVVKPKYTNLSAASSGMMIGEDKEGKIDFIDKTGKVTASIDPEKISITSSLGFGDGVIGAKEIESERCGLLGPDGKWKLEPTGKIKSIIQIEGKKAAFINTDDDMGIMDLNGETLIQPVYDKIGLVCSGDLILAQNKSDNWSLINQKEKNFAYGELDNIWFSPLFPDVVILAYSEHDWRIYNNKGKVIEPEARIYKIMDADSMLGDEYVRSQYVDVEALSKLIDIRENGIAGLTLDLQPKNAIIKLGETFQAWDTSNDSTHINMNPLPENYMYSSDLSDATPLYNFSSVVRVNLKYPENIAGYDVSYDYDEYESYVMEKYTYYFKKIQPEYIEVTVQFLKEATAAKFSKVLQDQIGTLGTKEVNGKDQLVVKTSDGYIKLFRETPEIVNIRLSKKSPKVNIEEAVGDTVVVEDARVEEVWD